MSKKGRNKAVTALTVILILIAAAAALYLMYGEDFYFTGLFGKGNIAKSRYAVTEDSDLQGNSALLTPVYDTKYLWEYGWQHISVNKPYSIKKDESVSYEEDTTAEEEEPETYTEIVTNWKGEPVTDENGDPVTEVRRAPETKLHSETVTDENGEPVLDENGEPMTTMISEKLPPAVTDENGEEQTDENGEKVTEKTTAIVTKEQVVGARASAAGVTDGETYTRMIITIDGDLSVTNSSVMSVTLRENSGLVNIPNTLVYNLGKGTCTLSPGKQVGQSCYVNSGGGKTTVTLIIPESARPQQQNTTVFRASSTISTFRDASGRSIDEFTVSVV